MTHYVEKRKEENRKLREIFDRHMQSVRKEIRLMGPEFIEWMETHADIVDRTEKVLQKCDETGFEIVEPEGGIH